jgi:hypothetical protein
MWTVTTTPMTGASRHQDLLDIGQDVTAGFGRGKLARWSSAMRGNSAMRPRMPLRAILPARAGVFAT